MECITFFSSLYLNIENQKNFFCYGSFDYLMDYIKGVFENEKLMDYIKGVFENEKLRKKSNKQR